MNPFRYRGYYLDTETNLYYLQSRYYDSYTGRFINADDAGNLGIGDELLSYNLFSYCANNPVMGYDPTGEWTISSGFNFSAFLFAGCSYSIFVSLDSHGNIALQVSQADVNTKGVVLGIASIGANCFASITKNDTVSQLEGVSVSAGASAGEIVSAGGELLLENKDGNLFGGISGGSFSVGISAGVDVHITASETQTLYQTNVFESFKKAWNKLCSWFN